MTTKKTIVLILGIILGILSYFAYNAYHKIYQKNTIKEDFIYVKTGSTFDDLIKEITPFVKDTTSFKWVAEKKKFTKIRSGKFKIINGLSNNNLINLLRSGKQTPVKVAFNNQQTLAELAGRIAQQIEPDSISLLNSFTNTAFLNKIGFTKQEALGMFIPNSYEIYWNTTSDKFRDRMYKEYQKFWNKKRLEKAKKLNLSPKQVITLASIVHKETTRNDERPIVAGLYLNRLRDKWPLQADPTIIYAMKQKYGQDFEMRRVLYKNIEDIKDSPYNTYKVNGLPPSLIAMPDISAIDAVLNAKNHDYFFMCASVTKIGYHEFAKTLAQHNANRKKFIAKKDKQGIKQ